MATSGVRTFSMDFAEIVDDAIDMTGGQPADASLYRYARRAANRVLIDWSNRSLNLWQMTATTAVLSAGTASYSLPDDCLDVTEVLYRDDSTGTDIDTTIGRLSRSEYANLSDKAQAGRPSTFTVFREVDGPRIVVWPVPDSTTAEALYLWYIRRNEDVASAAENIAVPDRFLPAFVAGIAAELAKVRPNIDAARRQEIKADYEVLLQRAQNEDRERVPNRILPDLSGYWRR